MILFIKKETKIKPWDNNMDKSGKEQVQILLIKIICKNSKVIYSIIIPLNFSKELSDKLNSA